nr:MAG TPA: tailspike protein [Caudoviricetes sp.]
MSISVKQLKKILGSFSTAVAKDVSGIKTEYATKKDVEGFAKLSDLNNTYIRKGDIHTEDYVTNVIFRDAYQNRLVKKTDLPALDTIATKQEISNAVAAIQVPSIEGLAKESEVETKLADYAKKVELPSVDGLAKTSEVEATYAKKSELPSIEGLATKAEVTEAVTGLAKASEVAETYATKEAVNAVAGLDADTVSTLKTLAQNSDLTTVAEKVKNVYTKAETDDKLATKADATAIPDVSGLATKQEVTAAITGITVPSIEGLAKTTDVDTKLSDYAKKTELPSIEGLAKVTEVDTKLAAKADVSAIPDVSGLAVKTEVETTYAKKTELPDISGLATKAELPSIEGLAKTTEVVAKSVYDEKVQSLESEISALKAKLAAVASGTTEQRPTENLVVGQQYFDTTLSVPVYWNGTEWHNPFANITTVKVENN